MFRWHTEDPHSCFLSCLRHDSLISRKGKALICTRDTICGARQCKRSTQAFLHFESMSKTSEFFKNPQNCTVINLTLFPCNVVKNKMNRYRVRKHGKLPFHLVLAQCVIIIKSKSISHLQNNYFGISPLISKRGTSSNWNQSWSINRATVNNHCASVVQF